VKNIFAGSYIEHCWRCSKIQWHVGEGNACQIGGWGGQRESGVEGLGDASNPPLGGRRELFYPKATWSQLGEGQEWHGLKFYLRVGQ